MSEVRLEGVQSYILTNITLTINKGELFVIIGPSGAGKTSLLQVLAGLSPYRGRIFFDGHCMDGLPPFKREVGYLFQDLLLFPHLTAKKNVLIGLKRLHLTRKERWKRVESLMEFFKITHLAGRVPKALSGGEKQRVALARAIASSPKVLLLDEPFSKLDFRTARYLRLELKRLQRRLKITTLFVTHNLEEARELGDRIAIIREGSLEQLGSPEDLWLKDDQRSFGFLEKPNFLQCTCQKSSGNGLVEFGWAGSKFYALDEGKTFNRVAIHPQDVYISQLPPPLSGINRFQGTVNKITETDGIIRVILNVEGHCIEAEMSPEHLATLSLSEGEKVYGILKLRGLHGC